MAVLLLAGFNASAAVELPYASGSFTDADAPKNELNDDGWSYRDYGVAESSWVNATNFPYNGMTPLRLGANTYYQASDVWLVSPKFKVKKGNEYKITFYAKSQAALNTITAFDAYMTDVNPIVSEENATATATGLAFNLGAAFTTTYVVRTAQFTAAESGAEYIAIRLQGQHGTPVFVADVNIVEIDKGGGDEPDVPEAAAPKAVTGLTASQVDNEMNVAISWTNPTLDINDNEVEITAIKVYRDDAAEPIATLEGSATSYVDENVEAGEHTYKVVACLDELDSEAATASVTVMAPVVVAPVPVTFSINSQDDFNSFTVVVGEGSTLSDSQHWRYNSLGHGSQLTSANGANEDDWFISPAFEVSEAGVYVVSMNAKIETPTYPYQLELRLGTSKETDSFDKVLATITEGLTKNPETYEYQVELQPGVYYIAARGALQNRQSTAQHYYVKALGVEKLTVRPGVATDVTVVPTAGQLEALISWTNPVDTDTEGVTLNAGDITKAEIYRNGELIATVEDAEMLVPGQVGSYTDDEISESDEYTYKVLIYSGDVTSKEAPAEVTVWVGPGQTILDGEDGTLFTGEDFADWTLSMPANSGYGGWYYYSSSNTLEFYRYSTATAVDDWAVSPRLEFENNTIYKIEISSYEYTNGSKSDYQLYVHLGSNTDYKELPQVSEGTLVNMKKGTTADARQVDCFYVATASKENVRRLAEDEEEETETPETGENTPEAGTEANPYSVEAGTLRLALHATDKADADFYIDDVRITKVGDATTAGAATIDNAEGVTLVGDTLYFDGKANVAVYNVAGALVVSADATGSYGLSALGNGIYLIRVTGAGGANVTLKIAR